MPSGRERRTLTVLQVVPALDTGGAERTTIDIAAALAARGDRALVASEGGRLQAELERAGGVLVRLPVGAKNPAAMALNAWRLARLIRNERVDIVHARSRAPAWPARLACRLTGTLFVTTFHGIYGEKNVAKRFYNSVMTKSDSVIANSAFTARLIRERYGTPAERVVVIPRGSDLLRFDPAAVDEPRRATLRRAWGLAGGERIVLHLARLSEWKGQKRLIEAAALPPLSGYPGLVVVLAGDAQGREAYLRELAALTKERGLEGRVRIVGHCDDPPAALSISDAAVSVSTYPEAFGRTAIEAAAMGVPVVAMASGATEETVLAPPRVPAAERTGWLVSPDDAPSLAGAIAAALRLSPEEREALRSRARRHAMGFATETMQGATLALYDRLLAEGASGGFLNDELTL